ncbi:MULTISPECIES: hypothetical protein [unclassified Rhizobium]
MLSSVARTPNDARQEVVDRLLDRQMGQGDRLSNALAEGFGAPDTAAQHSTALTDVRTADANRNYTAARDTAGSVNVTPILEEIDRTLTPGVNGIVNPRDNINHDSIEGALSRVRGMIADGRGSQVTDFNTLFRAKLDLDDMIQKATNQGAGNRAFALTGVKRQVDRALSAASPEFRNANDTFATQSGVIYLVDWGPGPTLYRAQFAGMGKVLIKLDNPLFRDDGRVFDVEQFNEMCVGFVVADIKVRDERKLREMVEGGRC